MPVVIYRDTHDIPHIYGATNAALAFGAGYGLVLPKLPAIPGPMSWGGLLMPLLWTGASYSLMGVVNPLLQEKVDWPSFIVAQFIFGLAAAVTRHSEKVTNQLRDEDSGLSAERTRDLSQGYVMISVVLSEYLHKVVT